MGKQIVVEVPLGNGAYEHERLEKLLNKGYKVVTAVSPNEHHIFYIVEVPDGVEDNNDYLEYRAKPRPRRGW